MPTDAIGNILGGATEAILGFILGFPLAYYVFYLQQKKKCIEWAVFSMPLARFQPDRERGLSLSVKLALLTGEETDKYTYVHVDNAYGFEIDLVNTGNDAVESPLVEIRLDDDAKIIDNTASVPALAGYKVTFERSDQELNKVAVRIPYMNPRQRITLRLTSTNNATRKCDAFIVAPNLVVKSVSYSPTIRGVFLSMLAGNLVLCSYAISEIYVTELSNLIPFGLFSARILLLPLGLAGFALGIWKMMGVVKRRSGLRERQWDWDGPSVL